MTQKKIGSIFGDDRADTGQRWRTSQPKMAYIFFILFPHQFSDRGAGATYVLAASSLSRV